MAVVDYQLILELPFPPTVNTYWRRVGNSTKISEKGRKYSRDVAWLVRGKKFPEDKRACVFIEHLCRTKESVILIIYSKHYLIH